MELTNGELRTMASIADYILKIMKKLDEIEKKVGKLSDSLNIKVDLSSRE